MAVKEYCKGTSVPTGQLTADVWQYVKPANYFVVSASHDLDTLTAPSSSGGRAPGLGKAGPNSAG